MKVLSYSLRPGPTEVIHFSLNEDHGGLDLELLTLEEVNSTQERENLASKYGWAAVDAACAALAFGECGVVQIGHNEIIITRSGGLIEGLIQSQESHLSSQEYEDLIS